MEEEPIGSGTMATADDSMPSGGVPGTSGCSGLFRSLDALRDRDFAYVFAGQTISMTGDAAFYVVIAWYTYKISGSSGAVSLVLGGAALAMVASLLFGGVIADRFDRRRVMVVTDLVRAALVAVVALLGTLHDNSVWLLAAISTLVGIFDGIFSPAFNGIVPALVVGESLESANGLLGFTRAAAGVAGPAIGSVLYAVSGGPLVFWVDAASFAVAALCSMRVSARGAPAPAERTEVGAPLREILDGARYVMRVPLLASIPVAALALMVSDAPTQSLLPTIVERHFHSGVWLLAAVNVAVGAGNGVGSLLYGHFRPQRSRATMVFTAWAVSHLVCAVLFLQGSVVLAVLLSVVRGALGGFGYGLWGTLLMRTVPEDKLSRVFSIDTFGCMALMPLGFAMSGLLIRGVAVSASVIVAVGQLAAGVLMASLLLRRGIRSAG